MKNLAYILVLFLAVISMAGCNGSGNGQSDGYRIVYISKDGSKEVEKIEALNDTDAVRQYTQKMTKIIFSNLDKDEFPYQEIQVLSPSGENLVKNEELLNAATGLGKIAEEAKELSGKMEELDRLSDEFDKAIEAGDMKKADSIQAEVEKIKFD